MNVTLRNRAGNNMLGFGTIALAILAGTARQATAQLPLTTAFTYQGELTSAGSPAAGTYDIRYRLYDAATGGTQIGSTLCSDNLAVTAGRFGASLDFGGAAFAGQQRFLEIEVRQDAGLDCSDASGYTVLTPRQELTAAPNATFAQNAATATTASNALTATNATSLNGQSPSFYQNAANLTGILPPAALSGTYTGPLSFMNPANIFTGNGAAISNLNATNISTGVLDAARMPTNWAAGGDLSGVYPNPTINAGAVTLSKLSPTVQVVLTKLRDLTPAPTPLDAVAWGSNINGQSNVPSLTAGVTYVAVAGAVVHSLALRSDGTVSAFGDNTYGQLNVPALTAGVTYTAVSCNNRYSLALRSNGTVAAWGDNSSGQLIVPALPTGVTYTAVASGGNHCVALRSDGTVAAWGANFYNQLNVPALAAGVTYVAVAAGEYHSLALRSDGTVAAWGWNVSGRLNVPALPTGVSYSAVAAGNGHSLALRSNGTVVAWGDNFYGQLNVPALPAGVTYAAIASGGDHCLALRSDGTVAAWGLSTSGRTNVPTLPLGMIYTAVAGGANHSMALRGTPVPSSLGVTGGLSIGSTAPPSANGGISVAGASSFAAGVVAASFSGSGAGLTSLSASNITSGTLNTAQVPNLDASKITTGTLSLAQVPNLDASKITTGTLGSAQIPNLDASKITTGTLADARISSTVALKNAANAFTSTGVTSFAGNVGIGTTTPNTQYSLQAVSVGDAQIALTGGPATGGLIPPRTWTIQSSGVNSTPASLNGTFQIIDRTGSASRLLIDTNGNVGIGTTTPVALLDLTTGSLGTADWQMVLNNSSNTSLRGGARLSNSGFFDVTNNANSTNPTFARLGNSGAWTNVSDARLKTDVASAEGNLAAAMKLRPVTFRWKTDGTQDFGMIAQEVREVLPMLVIGDESKEKLTVNYSQMSVVAIGAIQEQQQAITLLQAENAELKARLAAIETALLKMSKDHK